MKKSVFALCALFLCAATVTGTKALAADVAPFADKAQFTDMGFSPDGAVYLFAQYGEVAKNKTQQNGYAEVYAVDVAKNEFVPGCTFKVGPSYKTAGKSGEQVFNDIITEKDKTIGKYDIPSESNATVLYLANPAETESATPAEGERFDAKNVVTFRDFAPFGKDEGVCSYTVRLTELIEGNNESPLSCFYLLLELHDESGAIQKRIIVGNPQTKRKGVSHYRLNRVLKDKSGKSLVFVIEKHLIDQSGRAVRYMVETVKLCD